MRAGHINQVGSMFGYRFIITQFLDHGYIMFQSHKFHGQIVFIGADIGGVVTLRHFPFFIKQGVT